MTSSELFEYVLELPDDQIEKSANSLIGFRSRYTSLSKTLILLSDPDAVKKWSEREYGTALPIVDRLSSRYPLFILSGDVGTGKTEFARAAANQIALDTKKISTLFAISTRVRGEGRVGEASSRINRAFDEVRGALGKDKLCTLLIDEADSLVTSRGAEHTHLEDKVAVNTIIQRVDDLRRHGGRLIVFLSTNRVDSIDAAIIRRAAVVVHFDRPNAQERAALLSLDLEGLGLSQETIQNLVDKTGPTLSEPGFSFSDIRTKLLPEILSSAFPSRRVTDEDALIAASVTKASPVIQ